ncbi:MAG: AmmeMemoRadiSam system protein A [Defluviitaleaceae bacterium]|nr:AmmeMemoRadiSam system protein A [Defluviitaleaceae bacterium]
MPLVRAVATPHPPVAIPEVGRGRQDEIFKTTSALKKVAGLIASDKPDLIIFITPHGPSYADYIHVSPGKAAGGNLVRFGDAKNAFGLDYDEQFVRHIEILAESAGIPAGTMGGGSKNELDHGVTVPLYFIQSACAGFKAARISVSGLSVCEHYRFGACVKAALDGMERRAVVVASGDLSHKLTKDGPYGFAKEGPEFDKRIVEIFTNGDFSKLLRLDGGFAERAAECGLRPFAVMAGVLDGFDVEAEVLSYEGPFGVGYAVASFVPLRENPERKFYAKHSGANDGPIGESQPEGDAYVRLARETIEAYVRAKKTIGRPDWLPDEMLDKRAGAFVSIKKDGELRGCIGTIEPIRACVADEIIGNAISASTRDPRFEAIAERELSKLTISVDVLSPAEFIESEDMLDVLRYGVIVVCGTRRGLLLPNLEGVETVGEQIDIARRKAGIGKNEAYSLMRFEVVRHT